MVKKASINSFGIWKPLIRKACNLTSTDTRGIYQQVPIHWVFKLVKGKWKRYCRSNHIRLTERFCLWSFARFHVKVLHPVTVTVCWYLTGTIPWIPTRIQLFLFQSVVIQIDSKNLPFWFWQEMASFWQKSLLFRAF